MRTDDKTPERDDAWLDEALREAVPPPVSDTLHARVLRGFQGAAPASAAPSRPVFGDMKKAAGVAAALVMAVALAVINPMPAPVTSGLQTSAVQVIQPEDENDAVGAGLALIDDGPDVSDVDLALVWPNPSDGGEAAGQLDGLALE